MRALMSLPHLTGELYQLTGIWLVSHCTKNALWKSWRGRAAVWRQRTAKFNPADSCWPDHVIFMLALLMKSHNPD